MSFQLLINKLRNKPKCNFGEVRVSHIELIALLDAAEQMWAMLDSRMSANPDYARKMESVATLQRADAICKRVL